MKLQLFRMAILNCFPNLSSLINFACFDRFPKMAPSMARSWFLQLDNSRFSASISKTLSKNSREKGTKHLGSCLMSSAMTERTNNFLYFSSLVSCYSCILNRRTKCFMILFMTPLDSAIRLAQPLLNNLVMSCKDAQRTSSSTCSIKKKISLAKSCTFYGSSSWASLEQSDSIIFCGVSCLGMMW